MRLNELKKRMKGVDVVQVTPFNADGSVDLEGMRANTRWLAEYGAGKDFIITPVGSTGEFYAMSPEECKTCIKMVVEEVNGKTVVMAGAGRAGTLETIKMCQYAQSVGADGAMVVLPYYLIPQEEGMYLHYKRIAESVNADFGIMIYNNPDVSGSWIKPSLMARLSKIPNIIAVKENTLNIGSYFAMQSVVNSRDTVLLCGKGELMFSFETLYGCPGFISTRANFVPELSYSLYEAAAARDFDKLTEIINSYQPYYNFLERVIENHGPHTGLPGAGSNMYVALDKAAMDIIGLRGGDVRLPLVGLTEKERAELRDVLKTMNVI